MNINPKINNISMLSFRPAHNSPQSSIKKRGGSQIAYYETI